MLVTGQLVVGDVLLCRIDSEAGPLEIDHEPLETDQQTISSFGGYCGASNVTS